MHPRLWNRRTVLPHLPHTPEHPITVTIHLPPPAPTLLQSAPAPSSHVPSNTSHKSSYASSNTSHTHLLCDLKHIREIAHAPKTPPTNSSHATSNTTHTQSHCTQTRVLIDCKFVDVTEWTTSLTAVTDALSTTQFVGVTNCSDRCPLNNTVCWCH